VKIEITETRYDIDEKGDIVKMDILIKGTTNGVDHCLIAFVEYYTDGTHDEVYWEEEFEYPPMTFDKNVSEINHFKATSDDWKTWEYRIKGQMWIGDDDNFDDSSNDGKPIKERSVFVRAFKDAEETNWNQASETQKTNPDGSIIGDGDDGGKEDEKDSGFLPGFESFFFVIAIALLLAISFKTSTKRRK
jgi:hypothetical protein